MGTTNEAYFVVENAYPVWECIPGAVSVLEKRFGRNPKYNASLY
jgi:hypothetical protein